MKKLILFLSLALIGAVGIPAMAREQGKSGASLSNATDRNGVKPRFCS